MEKENNKILKEIESNTEMGLIQGEKIVQAVDGLEPALEGILMKAGELVEEVKKNTPQEIGDGMMFSVKGVKGDKGETGDKGEDGKDGLNGKDGRNGLDGKDGFNGRDGIDGKDGLDGNDGLDGKDGTNGLNGENGKDGSPDTREGIKTKIDSFEEGEGIDYRKLANLPDLNQIIRSLHQASKTVTLTELDDVNLTGVAIADGKYVLNPSLNDLSDVIAANPSTGQALVWNGSNWINDNVTGSGGGATLFKDQTPTDGGTYALLQGTIDGVNTVFTVAEGQYITGTLTVWLNGQQLAQGTDPEDWIETNPVTGTFTFNTAPQSATNDSIYVEYNTTAGGGGGSSPLTTKGDIYTYSTVDARLPVGTDGQALLADSTQATGLKWTTLGGGSGDMILASAQTNSGLKTFLDGTLGLRNVANTFTSTFTNTTTAARTYTLKDANGTIAFTSDITGTNSGTNTGDQTITLTGDVTGSGTGSFTTTIATGAVDIAMLSATGTPSGSTYLRGDNTWATIAGGGTVTATGGSLTANSVVLGAGTTDTKVVAGITTDGTSQLNLGVNTTTLGKLKLFGNTSGDVTLQPNAVAGTGIVLTLPATTGTLLISGGALGTPSSGTVTNLTGTASININGTVGATTPTTGVFTTLVAGSTTSLLLGTAGSAVGNIGFRNATSGTITLAPTTGALGTVTLTLPAVTGTLVTGGGTASGTNTGDQTITLTGDVTGSGTGSFATTIGTNVVGVTKMAQLGAGKFWANNTGSTANATEQDYHSPGQQALGVTPTFTAGLAPAGATNHIYNWTQIGNMVEFNFVLDYATDGTTITVLTIPFPSDMPAPIEPTAFTAGGDWLYPCRLVASTDRQGAGLFNTATAFLRRNAGDTAYEFKSVLTSGTYSQFYFFGRYFTA